MFSKKSYLRDLVRAYLLHIQLSNSSQQVTASFKTWHFFIVKSCEIAAELITYPVSKVFGFGFIYMNMIRKWKSTGAI